MIEGWQFSNIIILGVFAGCLWLFCVCMYWQNSYHGRQKHLIQVHNNLFILFVYISFFRFPLTFKKYCEPVFFRSISISQLFIQYVSFYVHTSLNFLHFRWDWIQPFTDYATPQKPIYLMPSAHIEWTKH